MRKLVCFYVFVILTLALFIQSCEVGEGYLSYNITVVNKTSSKIAFYLDDAYQFMVEPSERVTLENVEEGVHTLKVENAYYAVAERTINLDQDVEWTIEGW